MDEKKRQNMLLAGLGVVAAIFFGRSTVDGWVMKPIRDLQAKVTAAESEAESLSIKKLALHTAQTNVENWKSISLPPNIDDAQRLYREWIYGLTRQCGFSGPSFEVVASGRAPLKEYLTVSVEVKKAETDLQGLARFLFLFDQASILHRISAMTIDSPGVTGNPRLSVSFTAEGMSIDGTDDKRELLPRATLKSALTESANEISVETGEEFPMPDPFEPFLVRLERELVRVESVSETGWKIKRGVEGTKAVAHPEKSSAELFPVNWDRKDIQFEQYASLVSSSPFVIPSPPKTFNPRLAGVSDRTIKPGEEVKFTARAESLNPDLGEAQFALADATEGMAIDPKTGEFLWKPTEALAAGKYATTVLLTQIGNPDVKLNSKLTITIRSMNSAPELTLAESAVVIIGRDFESTATAMDDGPAESLTYSLGGGSPEGLKIDAATGKLSWTPARTFSPGKYDVEVKVTDSGDDAKSASKKISLDVRDDDASLTVLSGVFGKDDVLFAWFTNKGKGKTERLKSGDKLSVSEISAEIVEVTNRFVRIKDSDGIWKLELGDDLRKRILVEPAKKPDLPAVEAPKTDVTNDGSGAVSSPAPVAEKGTGPTIEVTPAAVAPGSVPPSGSSTLIIEPKSDAPKDLGSTELEIAPST